MIPGDGDAGTDAGMIAAAGSDAGATPGPDGGGEAPDAGDIENPPAGCGCASAGALDAVAFLAALALARRRRANDRT